MVTAMTPWQMGIAVGIAIGWITCAIYSAWEERRAADRAAADLREWEALQQDAARQARRQRVRETARRLSERRLQTVNGQGPKPAA